MKNYLILGLLGLTSLNVYASNLPANVLAEHATYVGFAPPEHRGTFKLQLLSTGVVQKIDNKANTTVVAKLSVPVVRKIMSAINNIKSDELNKPLRPPCMDAPTQELQVRKADGTSMTIWRRAGCQEHSPRDATADGVANLVNSLNNAFSRIDNLEN